ncbi:hypothetical protein ACHAXR_008508 [Thalassiosira sp. AJA248-18]
MDRRLWRTIAFALLFVATALRRMYYRGEHSDFEFLTSLMNIDAVPQSSSLSWSSSSSNKYATAKGADLIIFYNLYIPPQEDDVEGITNAINVIKDQMEQISLVLQRIEQGGGGEKKEETTILEKKKKGVVLYNLIGNGDAFPSKNMTDLCHQLHPRLECQLMQYYEEGGEAVTLQDVHNFCHSSDDLVVKDGKNETRVVYLHSKGSYHSQKENHIWRRQMTSASLHPDCLNPPDDRCDVCSAQFYIKYAIMFPGNMWSAKCSYIRKLIPPNEEYERRKSESIKRFLILRLWSVMQATLDVDNGEHYGLGRYQWEHWIASHPSIRPCEVHTTDVGPLILLGKDQKGRKFGPEHYDWGMGPRRITHNLGGLRGPRLRLERHPDLQFSEYYFLPGNLLKWFHLYGPQGVPAQESWVWGAFPAGERWKELVGQHGEKAIDVMVKNSTAVQFSWFHSAFASNHSDTVESSTATKILFNEEQPALSHSNPPPVVVFYQISFPPGNIEKMLAAVKSQFDVISMGQYDNVTSSFDEKREVLLYYTISGRISEATDFVSNLCEEKSDKITCRQIGRFDDQRAYGETLHQIHTFCNAKPSSNVVYISNRLPGKEYKHMGNTGNAKKIQTITSAVMSKMCIPSEGICNVCGTEFYPLPFFQFTGNMFSASCGYVNKLLPPSTFEERMNDIAGDALLGEIQEIYTTKLVDFNAQILGSYQHSIEHWIGSHPDLKPCDVAPVNTEKIFDRTIQDHMKHYSWSSGPRRDSAPPGDYDIEVESEPQFRLKREKALREYYYLAGNIFRWHRLYDTVPDEASWVWQWFPDGHSWQAAARTSGANAVNAISGEVVA